MEAKMDLVCTKCDREVWKFLKRLAIKKGVTFGEFVAAILRKYAEAKGLPSKETSE